MHAGYATAQRVVSSWCRRRVKSIFTRVSCVTFLLASYKLSQLRYCFQIETTPKGKRWPTLNAQFFSEKLISFRQPKAIVLLYWFHALACPTCRPFWFDWRSSLLNKLELHVGHGFLVCSWLSNFWFFFVAVKEMCSDKWISDFGPTRY